MLLLLSVGVLALLLSAFTITFRVGGASPSFSAYLSSLPFEGGRSALLVAELQSDLAAARSSAENLSRDVAAALVESRNSTASAGALLELIGVARASAASLAAELSTQAQASACASASVSSKVEANGSAAAGTAAVPPAVSGLATPARPRDIATSDFPTKNGETIRFFDAAMCAARAAERASSPAPPAPLIPSPFAPNASGIRLKILSFISHSPDFEPYSDGYGEALRMIAVAHDVSEYNWAQRGGPPDADALAAFDTQDYVLVKSNWNWYLDEYARVSLRGCKARLVLLISGTSAPPDLAEMRVYHTLFYETDWYWEAHADALRAHGRAYKAFGINTRVMNRGIAEASPHLLQPRPLDYVFVGHVSFTLKRADVLMSLPGSRLTLGVIDTADLDDAAKLRAAGVIVADGMGSYSDLAAVLRMAKNVVVPTPIWGGGERATLEGRACGAHVWVASDNVKLHELLCIPIPTHDEYSAALLAGLLSGITG